MHMFHALLDHPNRGISKERVKGRIEVISRVRQFIKFRATERQRVIYALSQLWGLEEDDVDRRMHAALERQSASMFDAIGLHLSTEEIAKVCKLYQGIWILLERHLSQKGYF